MFNLDIVFICEKALSASLFNLLTIHLHQNAETQWPGARVFICLHYDMTVCSSLSLCKAYLQNLMFPGL